MKQKNTKMTAAARRRDRARGRVAAKRLLFISRELESMARLLMRSEGHLRTVAGRLDADLVPQIANAIAPVRDAGRKMAAAATAAMTKAKKIKMLGRV